jgi:hypothetical protein
LLVAITAGIIATVLFFKATDLAKGNAQQLAVVEATQAGEVVFAVALEVMLLQAPLPGIWSAAGMLLVIVGMVLHSYVSRQIVTGKPAKNQRELTS